LRESILKKYSLPLIGFGREELEGDDRATGDSSGRKNIRDSLHRERIDKSA
jgi:hypothetical protein